MEATAQPLLDAIDHLLGPYAGVPGGNGGSPATLKVRARPPRPVAPLQPYWTGTLPDGTRMVCRRGAHRRQVELPGHVRADLDLRARVVRLAASPNVKPALVDACFVPILCDCLASAGHYLIHAGSLFQDIGPERRALIISGVSGAGKTTLTLALAGAGWAMLADDVTFYQPATATRPGQIWGIRTRCKVHSRTLELLPWLRALPAGGLSLSGERMVDSRPLPTATTGLTATPAAILFLNPRNPGAHRIEPLDKLAAITRLTRENVRAVDPLRHTVAAKTFAALAELVGSTSTLQASLCPRLDDLPDLSAWLRSQSA